jgi:phosphonate transport system substrate-binding protein
VHLYQPLAQDLKRSLGHPVRVVSALDYATFMARMAQQQYLLVINASHMARMAQLDDDYTPILRPVTDLEAVVVVPRHSLVTQLSELRGATVGVPSRIAQITQIAGALIREAGLEPGTDITLVHHPTHSSAIMAVIHGLAKVAVVSSTSWPCR